MHTDSAPFVKPDGSQMVQSYFRHIARTHPSPVRSLLAVKKIITRHSSLLAHPGHYAYNVPAGK